VDWSDALQAAELAAAQLSDHTRSVYVKLQQQIDSTEWFAKTMPSTLHTLQQVTLKAYSTV
jgi:hypothetical protein